MEYFIFIIFSIFMFISNYLIFDNVFISLIFPSILLIVLFLIFTIIDSKKKKHEKEMGIYRFIEFLCFSYLDNNLNTKDVLNTFNKLKILKKELNIETDLMTLLDLINSKVDNPYLFEAIKIIKENKNIESFMFKLKSRINDLKESFLLKYKNKKRNIIKYISIFSGTYFLYILIINLFKITVKEMGNNIVFVMFFNFPIIVFSIFLISSIGFEGKKNEK